MKLILIAIGVGIAMLFLMNSCSCEGWFNKGSCEWSETWLGGSH